MADGTTQPDAAAEGDELRSWDDFWSEVERSEAEERGEAATTVIRGVEVLVPYDLPLKFDRQVAASGKDATEQQVKDMLASLFGVDVLDAWVEAGMKQAEYKTILVWGMAHGKGHPITFAEAYEAVKSGGKSLPAAGNRAERRTSAKAGGRSKRTSAASTTSRRKK